MTTQPDFEYTSHTIPFDEECLPEIYALVDKIIPATIDRVELAIEPAYFKPNQMELALRMSDGERTDHKYVEFRFVPSSLFGEIKLKLWELSHPLKEPADGGLNLGQKLGVNILAMEKMYNLLRRNGVGASINLQRQSSMPGCSTGTLS